MGSVRVGDSSGGVVKPDEGDAGIEGRGAAIEAGDNPPPGPSSGSDGNAPPGEPAATEEGEGCPALGGTLPPADEKAWSSGFSANGSNGRIRPAPAWGAWPPGDQEGGIRPCCCSGAAAEEDGYTSPLPPYGLPV